MEDFSWLICPNCKTQVKGLEPTNIEHMDLRPNGTNIMVCLSCGQPSYFEMEEKRIELISLDTLKAVKSVSPEFYLKVTELMKQVQLEKIIQKNDPRNKN